MKALHPFRDGAVLPVYIANFVLMDYGSGAIFGCPAHDQRDLDFARKYDLPVLPVVAPKGMGAEFTVGEEAYRLAQGDAIYYDSRIRHTVRAMGSQPAALIACLAGVRRSSGPPNVMERAY